jgi:hypothetical protein
MARCKEMEDTGTHYRAALGGIHYLRRQHFHPSPKLLQR